MSADRITPLYRSLDDELADVAYAATGELMWAIADLWGTHTPAVVEARP